MTPVPEWRRVLRHAWSVRINLLLTLCSAAGSALMLVNGDSIGHPLLVPALAFGCMAIGNCGAIVSRVMRQKTLSGAEAPSAFEEPVEP